MFVPPLYHPSFTVSDLTAAAAAAQSLMYENVSFAASCHCYSVTITPAYCDSMKIYNSYDDVE